MKDEIKIVDYNDSYAHSFKSLNQEWIEQYFVMEEMDHKSLDHPKEYILDKGGYIAMALLNDIPVGTCALIKMDNPEFDFELAKMGVSPEAQGHGIGYALGQAIVNKAKALGAKKIFLESNTVLAPAINLYRKLGFKEIEGFDSPYSRCNIQMELNLQFGH